MDDGDFGPDHAKPSQFYFNSCMVVAMELKVLSIFALVATLGTLQKTFNVSHNTILQTATIYEFGKLAGAVVFALILPRFAIPRSLLLAPLSYLRTSHYRGCSRKPVLAKQPHTRAHYAQVQNTGPMQMYQRPGSI